MTIPWAMAVIEVTLVGVWIYLVWIVWRKKTNIFHDQMEPKLAERRLKRLKTFLLVAGISGAMFWVSILLGVVAFDLLEESNFVLIPLVALWVFLIATIGGLVIFLKGRRKTT